VAALRLVVTFSCFQTNEYVKLCFIYNFWHHVSCLRSLEREISGKNATVELGKELCNSLSCFSSPPAFAHSSKNPDWRRRHSAVRLEAMQPHALGVGLTLWCEGFTSVLQLHTSLFGTAESLAASLLSYGCLLCCEICAFRCSICPVTWGLFFFSFPCSSVSKRNLPVCFVHHVFFLPQQIHINK